MYDNKKVLKASDQRDIVRFVSSACYLRSHWPECFGRVKRTFCFTGAIDVLQGAVVRRPISAQPGFLFLLLKNISLDILSVIFESVQSSPCCQNEAFTSGFKSRTNPPRLGYLNPALNNPAQVLLKSKQLAKF